MGMKGSLRSEGLIVISIRTNRLHHPQLMPPPLNKCLTAHTSTAAAQLSIFNCISSYPGPQANSSPLCRQIDVVLVSCCMFRIPQRVRRSALAQASPFWTETGLCPKGHPNAQQQHSFRQPCSVECVEGTKCLYLICFDLEHLDMTPARGGLNWTPGILIRGIFRSVGSSLYVY